MFGHLGFAEVAILVGIALLIFGPSKIGDLGKSLGDGIRNFKSAVKDPDKEPSPVVSHDTTHP